MVECYMKTVEKHLRKVVLMYQKDWDEKLPLSLLAYRVSSHKITGMVLTSIVFGRPYAPPQAETTHD
jgi:hypothetical protein